MTTTAFNPADDLLVGGVFTTDYATLSAALDTVGAAIATRPTVPVLGGVLLESNGPHLQVSGFNYATTITVTLADAVQAPGRMLLPHQELSQLLKALTQGHTKRTADPLPVTVQAPEASCATVTLAQSTMPIPLLPVEDYPTLPTLPEVFACVDGASFTDQVKRVLSAIGRDDTLPGLTGVRIEPTTTGDGLHVAGSDRYRLAVGHAPGSIGDDIAPAAGVLVKGSTLGKILPRLGPEVSIGYGPTAFHEVVSLVSGPVSVIMSLHNDNEFIDYRTDYSSYLPTSAATTVVVNREQLLTHTQQAAKVMAAKEENSPLVLRVASDAVSVAPTIKEGSEYLRTPQIPATTEGKADVAVGLNPRSMTEALRTFSDPTISLHIQSPTKPVLLTQTPDGLTDTRAYRHLLMSVR
ncbi:DNA polymerase III subunit beta [Nocardiopsis nanhaiensis]